MARSAQHWEPPVEILSHFPAVSGNTVNGLGEDERRPPSPFFWHEASLQTHGQLQKYVLSRFYDQPGVADAYSRDTYPQVLKGLAKVVDGTPEVHAYEVANSTFHKIAAHN